ncbi:hypothetical protein [Micromonospora avicenniae]|uniref:hypothetical protein n=1 Tax=Micromonospora avicenniae TaxID=1198245 RepID=UPI00332AA4D3
MATRLASRSMTLSSSRPSPMIGRGMLEAHSPLLGIDILHVLWTGHLHLPSVEHHPEVYKHAVTPLMGNAREIITDEIKTDAVTLSSAWRRSTPEALA